MVTGGIIASRIIAPRSTNSQKFDIYECGIPTEGATHIQFNAGYYLFALIFLVFEVEIIFLFPWASALKKVGIVGFVEILIFLFILFLGLLYAWRKGALKWA